MSRTATVRAVRIALFGRILAQWAIVASWQVAGDDPSDRSKLDEDAPMRTLASRLLVVTAWTVPILVVIQAAMIGETLFGSASLVRAHGMVGNLVFLLAASALGLAILTAPPAPATLLLFSSVALLFLQTGLGYLGHRTGISTASSVHVALGVAIAVISAAAAMRTGARPTRTVDAT